MTLHLEHIVHFFPSVIRRDRGARKEPKKTDLNDVRNEKTPCENSAVSDFNLGRCGGVGCLEEISYGEERAEFWNHSDG